MDTNSINKIDNNLVRLLNDGWTIVNSCALVPSTTTVNTHISPVIWGKIVYILKYDKVNNKNTK